MSPSFSIITPSFRQFEWLELCAESVTDQAVSKEHVIQDAGTGPEIEAWAHGRPGIKLQVEKDEGMYDGINRALRRASGEVIAFLNCDEQYLPGTLDMVNRYFDKHPSVEVVFGDVIVVGPSGDYLCSRRVLVPTRYHTWVCTLPVFTGGTFFRRTLLDRENLMFSPDWEVLGDSVWVLELIRRNIRMATLDRFTSVFTDTGANLSARPQALVEQERLIRSAPAWVRKFAPVWAATARLRRLFRGHYSPKPFRYAIYTHRRMEQRKEFVVTEPTFRWQSRFGVWKEQE